MLFRKALAVAAIALAAGCSKSEATSATLPTELTGEWEKLERSMPPVGLLFTKDGNQTRARIRFSGAEYNGTAVVNGDAILLTFPGMESPLTGRLISADEMTLDLGVPTETRLRRRS